MVAKYIYIYKKFVGISAYMINAIGVLIDLVFLALFSILLYPLLTHVRTAKIWINFTPIVKDFSPKLRKMTNFSEKTDKYTTRKSKCYQMVLFLNEVIGPYVITIFCVPVSNIFVHTKMVADVHAEALIGLCCVRCVNF